MMPAIVEIPAGSCNKYETSTDGRLYLDRIVKIPYPHNYGFIPNTLAPDGDADDIFIVGPEPIHPGTAVKVRVLGFIEMTDNGVVDTKFIGVIESTNFAYAPSMIFNEIRTFLTHYKDGVELGETVVYDEQD
jgi:inorganic pyrophosphatase